ncbi:hypothetical protein ACE6H2_010520 [Prunus campanulata]
MEVLDLPLCASAQGFKALCKGSGNPLKEPIVWQVTYSSMVQGDVRGARCVAEASVMEAETSIMEAEAMVHEGGR